MKRLMDQRLRKPFLIEYLAFQTAALLAVDRARTKLACCFDQRQIRGVETIVTRLESESGWFNDSVASGIDALYESACSACSQ